MPDRPRVSRRSLALVGVLVAATILAGYFAMSHDGGDGVTGESQVSEAGSESRSPQAWDGAQHGGRISAPVGRERQRRTTDPGGERDGPSARAGSATGSFAQDAVYDPQRHAMREAFELTDPDAGAALPFSPFETSAALLRLAGEVPFDPDASCTMRVLPASGGRFNCMVRVVCGDEVVYPNQAQTAGYMRCELDGSGRPIAGVDRGHSALDGDPQVSFDLRTGELTVGDEGDGVAPFSASLRLR